MKAGRIHSFGPPSVIVIDEIPRAAPEEGELVVRVAAAGVGPWDALIREGKSVVQPSLPLILGSDLAGFVDSLGAGVVQFKPGDEVLGVTNKQLCGGYAEYAVASAQMVAARPRSLSFVEAASVPVVAVTAYQMLFDYAQLRAGQAVNPRSGWKCWRVCGATGEASGTAGFRNRRASRSRLCSQPRGRDRRELQYFNVRRCRAPRRCGARHGRRRDAASFIPCFKAGRYPRVVGFAAATVCGLSFSVPLGRRHRDPAGHAREIV